MSRAARRTRSTRASLLDRISWRASQLVKHVVRRSRRWLSTSRCAVATCCHLRASRSRRGTAVILAARSRAARARLAAAEELRLERCSGHRRRLSCLLLLVGGRRGVHLHTRGLLGCRVRLSGTWLGVREPLAESRSQLEESTSNWPRGWKCPAARYFFGPSPARGLPKRSVPISSARLFLFFLAR